MRRLDAPVLVFRRSHSPEMSWDSKEMRLRVMLSPASAPASGGGDLPPGTPVLGAQRKAARLHLWAGRPQPPPRGLRPLVLRGAAAQPAPPGPRDGSPWSRSPGLWLTDSACGQLTVETPAAPRLLQPQLQPRVSPVQTLPAGAPRLAAVSPLSPAGAATKGQGLDLLAPGHLTRMKTLESSSLRWLRDAAPPCLPT